MGVLQHRHSQNLHYQHNHIHNHINLSITTLIMTALTFFLLASAASARNLQTTQFGTWKIERDETVNGSLKMRDMERVESSEKRMVGPGSSPPTCRSKCGSCSPCKPAHVPIQPGLIITFEYYPEAWRCKCGNKLFMP